MTKSACSPRDIVVKCIIERIIMRYIAKNEKDVALVGGTEG